MADEKEVVTEEESEVVDEKAKKKAEKKKKNKAKAKGVWKDFKAFISRGNVIDMAIGVVIGGAFSAIVTAFTNILLSVCTWAVPGGLGGLVTVLPATSDTQAGITGIGQYFNSANLEEMVKILYGDGSTYSTVDSARTALLSKYTLHGSCYIFNGAAIIDWGAVINAAISFIIIAVVLFAVIKSISAVHKARLAAQAKAMEEYYKKHPEQRPIPAPKGAPELNERQLLKEILLTLKTQQANQAAAKAEPVKEVEKKSVPKTKKK